MKIWTILTVFWMANFLSSYSSMAQDILSQLKAIQEGIPEVNDGKYIYDQQLIFEETNPYQVSFTRTTITEKNGNQSDENYTFNIGFLDKNTVRYKSNGKQMRLYVGSGHQSLIDLVEDDKDKGWEKEFFIICDDVDTARELQEQIEAIIPIAKEQWENDNAIPDMYDELFTFLSDQVQEIEQDETTISQSIRLHESMPDVALLDIEITDEKGNTSKKAHQFSFGDLDTRKCQVDIEKTLVNVEAGTQDNRDFIRMIDEDDEKSFDKELTVYFDNPNRAFLFQSALVKLIPLGEEKLKERIPSIDNLKSAQEILAKHLGSVKIKDEEVTQDIIFTGYVTTLETNNTKDGKILQTFDFSDFNSKLKGDFSNNYGSIQIKTSSSNKYVKVEENGSQENYDNDLTFYVADVETMRLLEAALPVIINQEPEKIEPKTFEWLASSIAEANTDEFSQQIELEEGNCKVEYGYEELSKKGSSTDTFTFNLDDLNSKSVDIKVSGKQVAVETSTNKKEKIIQQYDNDGKLSYSNSFSFAAKDLFTAKQMVVTLEQLIEQCAE